MRGWRGACVKSKSLARLPKRGVLAHIWTGIGAAICFRVKARAAQKIILDELEVGVKAQRLVIDEALPGIGADNQVWYAQTVAILINLWWYHMVIEATPIVPGQEDRATHLLPVVAATLPLVTASVALPLDIWVG